MEGSTGEGSVPKLISMVVGGTHFIMGCWTEVKFPGWLLLEAVLSLLPYGTPINHQRWANQTDESYNPMLHDHKRNIHHLCHKASIRSKLLSLPDSKGGDSERTEHQGLGRIRVILASGCMECPPVWSPWHSASSQHGGPRNAGLLPPCSEIQVWTF
jgi:hypothetical protein